MSDEGRRIFNMETALGVIANKDGADVLDFLGFVISRPVCDCCRAAVAPTVKGWLYSLYPAFMKHSYDASSSYTAWLTEKKNTFGSTISITPMPAEEVAGIHSMLDFVANAERIAEEKTQEAADAVAAKKEADATIAKLTPFKNKAEELEKKVAQLEEKNKGLAAEVAEAKAAAAAFVGKVAINENEIEKAVKDIVTRAVGSLGAVAAAGGAAVAAAEPAASDFDSGFGDSTDSSGPVPDDFGFGASGPSNDGFGF